MKVDYVKSHIFFKLTTNDIKSKCRIMISTSVHMKCLSINMSENLQVP